MAERITPQELPGRLRRLDLQIKRAIASGMRRGAQKSLRILKGKTPKDTGELRNGWEVESGSGAEVVRIANHTPYAGTVELGASPHPIPEDEKAALVDWARRHLGARTSATGKRVRLRGAKRDAAASKLIGKLIAQLQGRGQRPTFFVRDALGQIESVVGAEVLASLGRLGGD